MTVIRSAAVCMLLASVTLADEPPPLLSESSKPGDVGQLGRHQEFYHGALPENAGNVRFVYDKQSALMRHLYHRNSDAFREFFFLIQKVDTTGWEKGEIKELPKPLKVVGWHKYKSSSGDSVEVQILEPVNPVTPNPSAKASGSPRTAAKTPGGSAKSGRREHSTY